MQRESFYKSKLLFLKRIFLKTYRILATKNNNKGFFIYSTALLLNLFYEYHCGKFCFWTFYVLISSFKKKVVQFTEIFLESLLRAYFQELEKLLFFRSKTKYFRDLK